MATTLRELIRELEDMMADAPPMQSRHPDLKIGEIVRVQEILEEADDRVYEPFLPEIHKVEEEPPTPNIFILLSDLPSRDIMHTIRHQIANYDRKRVVSFSARKILMHGLRLFPYPGFGDHVKEKLEHLARDLSASDVDEDAIESKLDELCDLIKRSPSSKRRSQEGIYVLLTQVSFLVKLARIGFSDVKALEDLASTRRVHNVLQAKIDNVPKKKLNDNIVSSALKADLSEYIPKGIEVSHFKDGVKQFFDFVKKRQWKQAFVSVGSLALGGTSFALDHSSRVFEFLRMERLFNLAALPAVMATQHVVYLSTQHQLDFLNAANGALRQLFIDMYKQAAYWSELPVDEMEDFIKIFGDHHHIPARLQARKYGFPMPKSVPNNNVEDLIDKKLPIVLIHGSSEDSLSVARELDRQGGVNVVVGKRLYSHKKTGKITPMSGIIYKNGELYAVNFHEALSPNYVYSLCKLDPKNTPISNLPYASHIYEHKDACNALIEDADVRLIPGFCLRSPYTKTPKPNTVEALINRKSPRTLRAITKEIRRFMTEQGTDQVVVKPTDEGQGTHVAFFNDPAKAAEHAKFLMHEKHNVLVEKRIHSVPITIDGIKKDWNLRVFVSRDAENNPVCSDMEVRIDKDGGPVNISISAAVMTYEEIMILLGISPEQAIALKQEIARMSVAAFEAVENGIKRFVDVPENAQQDWAGVDIIVSQEGDKLVPYLMEYNDHQSGGMWDLDDILPEEEYGRASRDLAAVIIRRATEHFEQRHG